MAWFSAQGIGRLETNVLGYKKYMNFNSFVAKQKVPTMKEVMNNQEDMLFRTVSINMPLLAT